MFDGLRWEHDGDVASTSFHLYSAVGNEDESSLLALIISQTKTHHVEYLVRLVVSIYVSVKASTAWGAAAPAAYRPTERRWGRVISWAYRDGGCYQTDGGSTLFNQRFSLLLCPDVVVEAAAAAPSAAAAAAAALWCWPRCYCSLVLPLLQSLLPVLLLFCPSAVVAAAHAAHSAAAPAAAPCCCPCCFCPFCYPCPLLLPLVLFLMLPLVPSLFLLLLHLTEAACAAASRNCCVCIWRQTGNGRRIKRRERSEDQWSPV